MLQNTHSIDIALKRYQEDNGGFPLSIYESQSLISGGYMEDFPRNDFNSYFDYKKKAMAVLSKLDLRAEMLLEDKWKAVDLRSNEGTIPYSLDNLKTTMFASFEYASSPGVLEYRVDYESLDATLPLLSKRFKDEAKAMGDICFGYELGEDIIDWWGMFPKDPGLDSASPDRKRYREFARGNFVYLPLDEDGIPIPYDKARTDFWEFFAGRPISKEKQLAKGYLLVLFGCPDYSGLDVWTPAGDPKMPVELKPDGIPDGVIMAITRMGDEEKISVF